ANKLRYYTPLTQDILRIVEETRKKVLGEGVQTSLVIGGVVAAAIAAGIGGYYGLRKKKS
ncbi:MAG: LPXTG cell wall anchor domain-containing protein, partial [Fervidicoccaceae archaeon]|nr:LPXTG cell wall anchor domain-containing protein [Fervidicoccaceae archaeon]